MKAKLIIEAKEIEVEISEEEYKKLQPPEEKKTGYERVSPHEEFYYASSKGPAEIGFDTHDYIDDDYYKSANYCSSRIVAENNARADQLMRQLRRFAVENKKNEINWWDNTINKYYIRYDYESKKLGISSNSFFRKYGALYFDSRTTAEAAIEEFHDELMWYFTEYKDSL